MAYRWTHDLHLLKRLWGLDEKGAGYVRNGTFAPRTSQHAPEQREHVARRRTPRDAMMSITCDRR